MEISEIKNQLSILKVLSHYNLTPNRNNMLRCPFHNDKTPSMQIYPKTNTFCCFSSNCKAGTVDQIEFIRLIEKCSKHQAILKAVVLLSGVEVTMINSNTKLSINPIKTNTMLKQNKNHDTSGKQTNFNELFKELTKSLYRSEKAIAYLKMRNLDPALLKIGYNTGRQANFMKNCIIFPLRNKNKNIIIQN